MVGLGRLEDSKDWVAGWSVCNGEKGTYHSRFSPIRFIGRSSMDTQQIVCLSQSMVRNDTVTTSNLLSKLDDCRDCVCDEVYSLVGRSGGDTR